MDFRIYAPTYLPKGYSHLRDESSTDKLLVGVSYGRGDARLLFLQGGWDVGSPNTVVSADAEFGASKATFLKDVDTSGPRRQRATSPKRSC